MDNQELNKYIIDARKQGLSDSQIRQNLHDAGWNDTEINPFFINKSLAVPAPHHQEADYHTSMWIVFQYILMFMTLAISAIALAGIVHHFIDEKIGAPNTYGYDYGWFGDMMLSYLASLIVAFPIFATLFIVLRKKIETQPEIRNIKARKLFVYLALLWTFIILVVRLVGVVYSFLAGQEYATASLAHLGVTLLISGSIFFYFVLDVRKGMK